MAYSGKIQLASADEVIETTGSSTDNVDSFLESSHLFLGTVTTHHQELPAQVNVIRQHHTFIIVISIVTQITCTTIWERWVSTVAMQVYHLHNTQVLRHIGKYTEPFLAVAYNHGN